MPTTRRQAAIMEGKIRSEDEHDTKKTKTHAPAARKGAHVKHRKEEENEGDNKPDLGVKGGEDHDEQQHIEVEQVKKEQEDKNEVHEPDVGEKRDAGHTQGNVDVKDEPPLKKTKVEADEEIAKQGIYKVGTIERGHIYFFYRPRVQLTEANSIDDVGHFHMLLVPRPPEFAQFAAPEKSVEKVDPTESEESEMKTLAPGADAVPAPDDGRSKKKPYRLITLGKKKLPDPDSSTNGRGKRKEIFWATVTMLGDDLETLAQSLGEQSYETKTRGTRHQGAARLAARGGYAIVNKEAGIVSQRETHFGYRISHPSPKEMGEVQSDLGIYPANSFILEIKNPLAPATNPLQRHSKTAEYPNWIMKGIFGNAEDNKEQTRGRESYGLRFASCETPELLDYVGAELLLIAAREGQDGLEKSLGEGRGEALADMEDKEAHESVKRVFDELGMDVEKFPVEPLKGNWI